MLQTSEGCFGPPPFYPKKYDSNLTLAVRLPGVPRSPRRTRRRLPGVPGSKKKKKNIYFFFFKMFNGKDSDMLVVIVGQYCSA